MADEPHFCREHGLLVDADDWLPVDPRDYNGGGIGLYIGCNRLTCGRCRQPVRHQLGFAAGPAATLAELASLGDWSELPEFRAGASARLYACACTSRLVRGITPLEVHPSALDFDDMPLWHCAGHPSLRRPGELGGFTVDDTTAWSALAQRAMTEAGSPPLHRWVDGLPGFAATRLYQALDDPADRAALSLAIAALAVQVDAAGVPLPEFRIATTLFFALHPLAEGVGHYATFASQHLQLFRGVPAGWGPDDTLDSYLFYTLLSHLTLVPTGPSADAVRHALRVAATTAPGLGVSLNWYAGHDRTWALDHLEALVLANPKHWEGLLAELRPDSAEQVVAAAKALLRCGAASRAEVLAALADANSAAFASEVAQLWAMGQEDGTTP